MGTSKTKPRGSVALNRVLLTVSGTIPDGIAGKVKAGERPRSDYLELSAALDADLLDYESVRSSESRSTQLISRLGGLNAALAWACFRRRHDYDVILTDGEQVGLPLACFSRLVSRRRCARHVMIVHILSVPKKIRLYRLLRLGNRVDGMIVYSSAQQRFAVDRLGFAASHVHLRPFMVDTVFFDAAGMTSPRTRPMICAAGLECRDYPTMLDAVTGLDADVVIAAASPWSKRADGLDGIDLPVNVSVVRLDLFQLRQLYAEASVVVLPLQPVDFQAGITTILEAMSMERPVICTRTSGQTDTIIDGETGRYVPPLDIAAMRQAIDELLADPGRAAALGAAGRAWVREHADIGVYARSIGSIVDRYRPANGSAKSVGG